MSLSKKVVLTVSGYKISLSDSLQFYQNDQLKLIFEINKYGIDVASSFTHKTLMPLQPLTATLFIETPLGVDSIESANIEDNAVTFYLTSNQTQHIGTSTMQIKLTDDDGCQITLPSFTFEVQKNIYDNAVHVSGILLADENGNVLSDENGNTVNATATTESSKQIKDFSLKTEVSGQEDILVQDNGVTKRIKSNELIDTVDLTGYATETYVQNKIAEASLSGGEVDLSGLATKDDLNQTNAQLSAIKEHCTGGNGMQEHSHVNKTVLDKLSESENSLFFDGKEIGGKIDNGSIAFNKLSADVFENKYVYSMDVTGVDYFAMEFIADKNYAVGDIFNVSFIVLSGLTTVKELAVYRNPYHYSASQTVALDSNKNIMATLTLTKAINKGDVTKIIFSVSGISGIVELIDININGGLEVRKIYSLTNESKKGVISSYFTRELVDKEEFNSLSESIDLKIDKGNMLTEKYLTVIKKGKRATWDGIWTIFSIEIPNETITADTDINVSFEYEVDDIDKCGNLIIYHGFGADDLEYTIRNKVEFTTLTSKINYTFRFAQDDIDMIATTTHIKITLLQILKEANVICETRFWNLTLTINGNTYKGFVNAYNGNGVVGSGQTIRIAEEYPSTYLATGKQLNSTICKPAGLNIICAGDSLTNGYNGATNSYVDYVKDYFADCNVYNKGSDGGGAGRLINMLTPYKRESEIAYTGGSDFLGTLEHVDCVVINIGTNDFTNGNFDNDIPKFNFTTIENALNGGFEYNGEQIDTLEKYWGLFANTWYGNLAMLIEYIQWKYPMCQILLTPPTSNSCLGDDDGRNPHTMKVKMEKIAELYGIKVIDVIQGLGINKRNNHLWRVDYCHGNNARNEKVGRYLAKQIFNELLV